MAKYIKADITPIIENFSKWSDGYDHIKCGDFLIMRGSFNNKLSIFMSGPKGELIYIEPSGEGDIEKLSLLYDTHMDMESQEHLAKEAVDNALRRLKF